MGSCQRLGRWRCLIDLIPCLCSRTEYFAVGLNVFFIGGDGQVFVIYKTSCFPRFAAEPPKL